MPRRTTTIVVAGAVANKYQSGGEAWVRMSWLRGFEALGHDTWFIEQLDSASCTNANGDSCSPSDSKQVAYFDQVMSWFQISDRCTLLIDGRPVRGPSIDELKSRLAGAHLINISGHLTTPSIFENFATRSHIDIDPGFTQFWHAERIGDAHLEVHDLHFTIGENIGLESCSIPAAGIDWIPIRQPVVIDDWPLQPTPTDPRFTTIGNWRGPYGSVEFDGQVFGLKLHEFRKMMDLPRRTPARLELAMAIHDGDHIDRHLLVDNGWILSDPILASATPESFRAFVQESAAEFSVAQGIYVATNSGWFSDRTVRYLASGRPAVVQNTGFADHLPTGDGLLGFSDVDEAAAALTEVSLKYEHHAASARRIAVDYFSAEVVLPAVLDRIAGVR